MNERAAAVGAAAIGDPEAWVGAGAWIGILLGKVIGPMGCATASPGLVSAGPARAIAVAPVRPSG